MAWSVNWTHVNPIAGMQGLHVTDTTQNHPLGMIVQGKHATYGQGEFIYLLGVANTVVHSWVTYNMDDGSTTLAVADAIGPCAVAMSANVASQYGWYQIQGKTIGKCKTGFADNGEVYLTSTDGSVDDASVAGDRVSNAKGASTTTVNTFIADFEIERPWVDNRIVES